MLLINIFFYTKDKYNKRKRSTSGGGGSGGGSGGGGERGKKDPVKQMLEQLQKFIPHIGTGTTIE